MIILFPAREFCLVHSHRWHRCGTSHGNASAFIFFHDTCAELSLKGQLSRAAVASRSEARLLSPMRTCAGTCELVSAMTFAKHYHKETSHERLAQIVLSLATS